MEVQERVNEPLLVGENVLARRSVEDRRNIKYPAFCRVETVDNFDQNHTFWLVERTVGELVVAHNFTGAAIGAMAMGGALGEGLEVSKNARFGLLLDELSEKPGAKVPLINDAQRQAWGSLQIVSTSYYSPFQSDARDGAILLKDDFALNFGSLRQVIGELKEANRQLAEAQDRSAGIDEDAADLLEVIRKKEAAARTLLASKQKRIRHIIAEATLRSQPKLDAQQIVAKQRQLLSGALIIDGGPGTGKTTTMIDRINFLTDPNILEHVPDLSNSEFDRLRNPETGYLLFTPNELLMHYLRNAMGRKGLVSSERMVKTWDNYRKYLAGRFGFLPADMEASRFERNRVAFRQNTAAFRLGKTNSKKLIRQIQKEFLQFVGRPIEELLEVDPDNTSSPKSYAELQLRARRYLRKPTLPKLYRLLIGFDKDFSNATKESRSQSQEILQKQAARILAMVSRDETRLSRLNEIIQRRSNYQIEEEFFKDEEAQDIVVDASESPSSDALFAFIRTIVRKIALMRGIDSINLTGRENEALTEIENFIDFEALNQLSPALVFLNRTGNVTSGAEQLTLSQIERFYKHVRKNNRDVIDPFLYSEPSKSITEFVKNGNKELFPDELDLLLFLTLWTVRGLYRSDSVYFDNSNNGIIRAFKDEYREIVAVDEATDFTSLQLLCMSMMANPQRSCITLSGDLMQRMTTAGLQSWGEFEDVFNLISKDGVERAELTQCYRQSPRLLDLTGKLWTARTGQDAPYESAYADSEHDPNPLILTSPDMEDTADWLAARIVEVRSSYESEQVIPTIAVFVPDDRAVEQFANALDDSPKLGNNISIEACLGGKVLGAQSKVRVFSIEHIKGLEFEAAFFVHLDEVAKRFPGLVDRMLYVGLSRASLYMGITVKTSFPNSLAYLQTSFGSGNWSS